MPLYKHLRGMRREETTWNTSFSEVEKIIRAKLPRSAREYDAWWGNHPDSHTQAKAWIAAGWEVSIAEVLSETVTFRKTLN